MQNEAELVLDHTRKKLRPSEISEAPEISKHISKVEKLGTTTRFRSKFRQAQNVVRSSNYNGKVRAASDTSCAVKKLSSSILSVGFTRTRSRT